MLTQFDAEPIDVLAVYQKGKENICIYKIRWNNRAHSITKIGYHHKVKSGSTLLHIFHVSNNSLAFKLTFHTDTLEWKLTEVSDGQPN